jgi:hypothetical protein
MVTEFEKSSMVPFPLIFSTCGGLGKESTVAYKRIAEILAIKRKSEYGATLTWVRCCLSFALLRSAIACIRGTRKCARQMKSKDVKLGFSESQLCRH